MEHDDVVEAAAVGQRRAQGSRRRCHVPQLAVALVDRQHETVSPREPHGPLQVVEVGHGTLRVRGRAKIEQGRPFQQGRCQDVEVGQEAGGGGGREQHRLGTGHDRRTVIDRIDRVRHQHRRHGRRAGAGHQHGRQQIEAFLGAGERQHVAVRIERIRRQLEPPRQPAGSGGTELGGAVDRWVAVPLMRVGRHRLGQQGRRRMLGLAQRQIQGRAGRSRNARQQRRQTAERKLGQTIEAFVALHGLQVNRIVPRRRSPEPHAMT